MKYIAIFASQEEDSPMEIGLVKINSYKKYDDTDNISDDYEVLFSHYYFEGFEQIFNLDDPSIYDNLNDAVKALIPAIFEELQ